MGSGDEGAGGEELRTNALCPIPDSQFPTPYSLLPIKKTYDFGHT
ncbi:hypothetical protein COO91_02591 [Nostoc flagelliforme CCNUN1]|uniref:Uncharacterized protein n=1 Tax=Nostoc flagelliforme CCNUN1 TaxID=2038116 RepID=A0A2K8SMT4_9NOSO|nr:hypothetical protein COO91_02591 [Nostoc flagelliforme CCNUN1]